MSEQTTTVERQEVKDVLVKHRNNFQKSLLDNLLDLRRHEARKIVEPDYQRRTQNGQFQHVDELIEIYSEGVRNSKAYLDIIDELLAMDEAGTLSEAWAHVFEAQEAVPTETQDEELPSEAPTPSEEPAEAPAEVPTETEPGQDSEEAPKEQPAS